MKRYLPSVVALALAACIAPACVAAYTAHAEANTTALGRVVVNNKDEVVRGISDSDRDTVLAGAAIASAGASLHVVQDSADAGGGSNSSARVEAGGIHLAASATGSALFLTPGDSGFARIIGRSNAYAGGSFSDGLTFFVPSLAMGAPLVLTFSVDVTGSLASLGQFMFGTGYGTVTEMRWNVALGSASFGESEREYNNNGTIVRGAPATGVWSFASTVGNGVATLLSMEANVGAAAQGGINCGCGFSPLYGEGRSDADFSHTFGWNGIQGISDAFGNPLNLAELQAVSSSGFDYLHGSAAAPVPELSSPVLLTVGMLALLAFLRQRRAVA